MKNSIRQSQKQICARFGVEPCEAFGGEKVGISDNATAGLMPLNGLRHPPTQGVTGWYLWGGTEFSDAADFFKPVHLAHLESSCELGLKYLLLPPGWRFLTDGTYEDVWFDSALLEVDN
ncbi:immunity protein Imm33 domain-containing protein [Roseovarius phycicola]|uniref:Imm33-like domain-containing protein n=1 Tax=Roseovarius phycicola TaxID=3080976 RepID=A0ABZ2HK78_9RHOB